MEDLEKRIEALEKIITKQNNLLTRMAKAMYLIPASEKELKDITNTRQKNTALGYKAYEAVENAKTPHEESTFNIFNMYNTKDSIYGDVLADDYLTEGD